MAEARLDDAGVSLWLTDWKVAGGGAWSGRRIMALVGGAYAVHLDLYVHPDGQAVDIANIEVSPDHRRRRLASVMMDALYAAYPTAWINPGGRSPEGAQWWDQYSDPAPERNIHNRPPAEWSSYFEPVQVMAQKARNAYHNKFFGLDGHRDAEYRYGESLEEEAERYAGAFREPGHQGPDPAAEELYGGQRLVLPPRLHRLVHNGDRDVSERAGILLRHIGHGNLPHDSPWNNTEHAVFEDLATEQIFDPTSAQPVTHLTFHVLPLSGPEIPLHDVKATWITYVNSPGISVQLAGMSWRSPNYPTITHAASFSPPVQAAIGPKYWQYASDEYRARYDEIGELLPRNVTPPPAEEASPCAGREAEILALADRLQRGIAQRATDQVPVPADRSMPQDQTLHHQHPPQQSPHLR